MRNDLQIICSGSKIEEQVTYSMLCRKSPLGNLNFLILSAEADVKVCLMHNKH
jgi:hypothetical protein